MSIRSIEAILQCPRCGSDIANGRCLGESCPYNSGFPESSGQLVLIDFEHSIFDIASFSESAKPTVMRRPTRGALRSRVRAITSGGNPAAANAAADMLTRLRALPRRARVLVVGGGVIGLGAERLYDAPDVELIGTDVYSSPHTLLVADGHSLPFKDRSFDGVWIQAVLEHVLEPTRVVNEILRVLRPGGLVYAETPFMQQVHEDAYDFTRFTLSGHRWLFKNFTEISSGSVAGAGTSFVWSVRYLLRAMGLPSPIWRSAGFLTFPFRFLDKLGSRRAQADGASCVYFFGVNNGVQLHQKDMVRFYEDQSTARTML